MLQSSGCHFINPTWIQNTPDEFREQEGTLEETSFRLTVEDGEKTGSDDT